MECRKTKTKVITLTNHNRRKQPNGPIRIRRKCQARENTCDHVMIGGAIFGNQSQSVVKQNQSNYQIKVKNDFYCFEKNFFDLNTEICVNSVKTRQKHFQQN